LYPFSPPSLSHTQNTPPFPIAHSLFFQDNAALEKKISEAGEVLRQASQQGAYPGQPGRS
jgi:hypothetical protein